MADAAERPHDASVQWMGAPGRLRQPAAVHAEAFCAPTPFCAWPRTSPTACGSAKGGGQRPSGVYALPGHGGVLGRQRGGDRQRSMSSAGTLHGRHRPDERDGEPCDLLDRLARRSGLRHDPAGLDRLMDPARYIGRCRSGSAPCWTASPPAGGRILRRRRRPACKSKNKPGIPPVSQAHASL